MGKSSSINTELSTLIKFIVTIAVIWTLAIGISLWYGFSTYYNTAEEYAKKQARTAFDKDVTYHKFVADLGGVYVPSELMKELFNFEGMDNLNVDDSTRLTLLDPTSLLNLIYELGYRRTNVISHLTSNDPSFGDSKPDEWESKALMTIEKEQIPEISEIQIINNEKYMRLMRPMYMEESCTPCHSQKIDELIGGISVSVPMSPILDNASRDLANTLITHLVFWLFGLGGCYYAGKKLSSQVIQTNAAQRSLQALTEELEIRVQKRTKEMVKREQELRAFIDNSEAGFFITNTDKQFVVVNKRMERLLNCDASMLIGTTGENLIVKSLYHILDIAQDNVLKTGHANDAGDFKIEDEIYNINIFPIFDLSNNLEAMGTMVINVTERKQIENDLRAAKEVAESASKAKSDFLANVSHEVRTPLNGVIGMADLLLRTNLSGDQASMVTTIKNSSYNLLGVLNDILDFSKVEAGKIVIDPIEFSLRDLVFESVRGLSNIACKKGVELIVHVYPTIPDSVIGDSLRIRQIVLNLLTNAIKFTDKGEVSFKIELLRQDNEEVTVRFIVEDTGIGIPDDKQKRIFAAFEQADGSITRKFGGTGLGLAISGRLADLMGSKINLESKIGEGSKFWFDLKLPYNRFDKLEPVSHMESLKGLKALILDDNATNRQILSEQLAIWNINCVEFSKAEDALKALKKSDFNVDLILSDFQMPEMDGITFSNQVKKLGVKAPVILLTSCEMAQELVENNDSSYEAHLEKPVIPRELIRTIASLLGKQEAFETESIAEGKIINSRKKTVQALNILLVEDMEVNQIVAKNMLTDLGHKVTIASNGQEAVNKIAKDKFDIIFMDVQMPIMDGINATKVIRAQGNYVPIVAMTAHALKGDKEKFLNYGMDDYIAKPILIKDLENVIERVMIKTKKNNNLKDGDPQNDPKSSSSNEGIIKKVMDKTFGDNRDLAIKSMELFIRDSSEQMDKIGVSIERDDCLEAYHCAHALKGISSYFTDSGLYLSAYELESKARGRKEFENKEEIEKLYKLMKEQYKMIIKSMKEYIKDS